MKVVGKKDDAAENPLEKRSSACIQDTQVHPLNVRNLFYIDIIKLELLKIKEYFFHT